MRFVFALSRVLFHLIRSFGGVSLVILELLLSGALGPCVWGWEESGRRGGATRASHMLARAMACPFDAVRWFFRDWMS